VGAVLSDQGYSYQLDNIINFSKSSFHKDGKLKGQGSLEIF
jgi:hypothetical protein